MVKLIIHTADLHIRNNSRHDEFKEQLGKFIDKCKELAEPYDKSEVRIVLCGDIFHSKNDVSTSIYPMCASFIKRLEEIGKVICIAGNHDLLVNNLSKIGALESLFATASFENAYLLDETLGFESGYVTDDNITWAVYSIYNDYIRPDIEKARRENPTSKVIGLYHGMVVGAEQDNGTIVDNGVHEDVFDGCDAVMMGHIHRRQEINKDGIPMVYSGSILQNTFGETITQHGFYAWNVETLEYKFVEIESEYGLYNITIDSIEDIDNDKEVLSNY